MAYALRVSRGTVTRRERKHGKEQDRRKWRKVKSTRLGPPLPPSEVVGVIGFGLAQHEKDVGRRTLGGGRRRVLTRRQKVMVRTYITGLIDAVTGWRMKIFEFKLFELFEFAIQSL